MAKQFFGRLVCLMAVLLVGRSVAVAQTAAGDVLRGQGAYLKGLGWYNLKTAEANSVHVDSTIRWKADLRKIQRERWDDEAKRLAGKKLRIEEVILKQLQREQQLRLDPTVKDVLTGEALNVLVYDLTDPSIKQSDWTSKTVSLPPGTSVKDLIFRFMPQAGAPPNSAALSKGVISLSRLDIKGKWPTFMEIPALAAEKSAYENAYAKVRDEFLAEKFNLKSLLDMDRTLDTLKEKVKTTVPAERDYRAQGLKFVDDLKASTRMFDAGTVDYAKDILTDTKNGDATTVAELVAFMLKYRLQFAPSDRSPTATELYPKLYEALRQQANELGIKPPEILPLVDESVVTFQEKSVWICDKPQVRLTVTERKGDSFRAQFIESGGRIERAITGTVKDGKLSWFAKDTRAIKGSVGGDNHGTFTKDKDKIDFVWRHENGASGTYTLRLIK